MRTSQAGIDPLGGTRGGEQRSPGFSPDGDGLHHRSDAIAKCRDQGRSKTHEHSDDLTPLQSVTTGT